MQYLEITLEPLLYNVCLIFQDNATSMLAGAKYGFANQKSGIFNGREVMLLWVYNH